MSEEFKIIDYIQHGLNQTKFGIIWPLVGPLPIDVNYVYFASPDKRSYLEQLFDEANSCWLIYHDFLYEHGKDNLDNEKSKTLFMLSKKLIQSLKDFSSEVKRLKADLLPARTGTQNEGRT